MLSRYFLSFRSFSGQNIYRFASSTSSSTKTGNEIQKHYRIPPRLPYIDGYLNDFRTDRPILSTINYKDKTGKEREIQN
uniref:Uncharacterized protein n=1 Tax=Panagrolaimus superbus TaxID=310955 RepID=A0A914YU31_9BILA